MPELDWIHLVLDHVGQTGATIALLLISFLVLKKKGYLTVNGNSGGVAAYKQELVKFETKIEDLYLTKIAHMAECKVTKLEGKISLKETLDEIFEKRNVVLDSKFKELHDQIVSNRETVIGQYAEVVSNQAHILQALKELKK